MIGYPRNEVQKMKNEKNPKYSVYKSIRYMLKKAWRTSKVVIWAQLLVSVVTITQTTAELYLAPRILQKVEQSAPLGALFATILVFTGLVFALKFMRNYLDNAAFVKRVAVRTSVITDINAKALSTSYPNCFDPDLKNLFSKAMDCTNSNSSPAEHIWTTMGSLLSTIGCSVMYLVTLSNVEPILIAVTIITCLLATIVRLHVTRKYENDPTQGKFRKEENYVLSETQSVQSAKDIRMFGLRNWIERIYEDVLRAHIAFIQKKERDRLYSSLFGALMTILQNGVAYVYLLKLVLDGGLSASEFLLYFSAISGFTTWFSYILDYCSLLYRETQGIGTVLAYIECEEPFRFSGGRPLPDLSECELRLENVTFRYAEAEKPLFENLNLTLHAGEKLAVVGLNGAGKTTLVKLLCGFYDPTEGRVTLNGIDIREFNRREYYGLLCAVYQQFSVMDVTIAENVAQAPRNEVDEARVWDCLSLAGLDEFVRTLPQGLDTHVGRAVYFDGVLFSGGQTQRLMLARALYKNAPILVLDEPTAALDPLAESDIYEKYNEMAGGKTSIFISHRLASTRFCDRIVFLANGKIAEEGTHEALLAKQGAYAELYEVQSRYYQEGADFHGEDA